MFYFWYKLFLISILNLNKRLDNLDDEISVPFRVRLFDCDGLQVMAGFQYPFYMDLARWTHIIKGGFLSVAIKNGWAPVLGSQKIVHRKPLKIFSKFTVKVLLAGWDDKWFYHVHLFEQNNLIKAVGITKAGIWKNHQQVLAKLILEELKLNGEKKVPVWITDIFDKDLENFNKH